MPEVTKERLLEYQVQLTADMLMMGVLQYDQMPTDGELEKVDLEKVQQKLRYGMEVPQWFRAECAKLRRYSHWEGPMFMIDYQKLRRYMFQHFGELTQEQRIALFEYDVQLAMIHRDMGPTPDPSQRGGEERLLPESLATEKAMALWRKVQKAGYVDENYQPTISRTQAAMLADAMAERLKIKDKWKVFETLWKRRNMRNDYNNALDQRQTLEFQEIIKKILSA